MKVILIGINHSKNEEEIEVAVSYEDEDSWTFEFGDADITVSDLTPVMEFLEKQAMR